MPRNHYEWKQGKPAPDLGRHSRAKHQIIDRYLRRYIDICTATPVQEKLNLTIVDGFSGGGKYQLDGESVEGSPLILLRAIVEKEKELNAARQKGFRIHTDFVFIDQNRYHTDYLRAEIEQSEFANLLDNQVRIWTADFNQRVDDAIEIAAARNQKGRSLFVLDQYGWSDVTFESIRRILRRLPKAEIFLTFLVDNLISYLSEDRLELEAFSRIEADAGWLRELLAEKGENDGWRTYIQNGLYKHIQEQTGAQFYSPFFVRSRDSNRSYWLLHLSRHREARNEIGKIHWEEHNVSLHHGGAGLNALGFRPETDGTLFLPGYDFDEQSRENSHRTLMNQVPDIIGAAVGAGGSMSLEDLFGTRCNDTPVTRDMFERALRDLRSEGEIRIEDAYGREKPRALTVQWSDRIMRPPQRTLFGPFG